MIGRDAFLTHAEAVRCVRSMILDKQKSLNKQLLDLMVRMMELDNPDGIKTNDPNQCLTLNKEFPIVE